METHIRNKKNSIKIEEINKMEAEKESTITKKN